MSAPETLLFPLTPHYLPGSYKQGCKESIWESLLVRQSDLREAFMMKISEERSSRGKVELIGEGLEGKLQPEVFRTHCSCV